MKRSKFLGALGIACIASIGAAARATSLPSTPFDASYYQGHPQDESAIGELAKGVHAAWSFTKREFAKLEATGKLDHTAASPLDADYYWRGIVPRAAPGTRNYVDDDNPLTPRYYIDHPDGDHG